MNVTIPKSVEDLVRRKIEEGRYTTEAEVVTDALRLMDVRQGGRDRARQTARHDRPPLRVLRGRRTARAASRAGATLYEARCLQGRNPRRDVVQR